jgi:hypothetical protein
MPESPRFRDAADLPQASYRHDFAAEIDQAEEALAEIVDRVFLRGELSLPIARTVFRANVVAVCVTAIREASAHGWIEELTGETPAPGNLEMLARLLAEIIDAENPRLHAKCIDFVLGLGLCQGKSETQIAREEGVGKAAVSKRCKVLQKTFGVPPSRGMKREEACASYSKRQMGKRAKPMPQAWSFAGLLGRAAYGQA